MKNRRHFLRKATLGLLGLPVLPRLNGTVAPPSWQDLSAEHNDAALFRLLRSSLLIPQDMVYLNTGSLGPSPRQIVDEVSSAMHELERNPVINNWGALGQQMEAVRQKVAHFIGAEEEEIVLTRNTTEGINLIGSCLKLQPGDEILTTTHEHGGGENGLLYLAENQGAHIRKIALPMPAGSVDEVVKAIQQGITDRTRVVLLSHVSTITGLRMPFAQIAALTRPRNILLIADGAQAPGQIEVAVKALGVDIYASSGHKWLLGPKETGFLYLRKEIQEQIQPVFTRGSYKAYSAASGTRNVATIIGLGAALDLQQLVGVQKIEARCLELAQYCRKQLVNLPGVDIISPSMAELQTGIVSIRLEQLANRAVFEQMKEAQLIIKVLPKYNGLRFSLHFFNNEAEVDQMVAFLASLLR